MGEQMAQSMLDQRKRRRRDCDGGDVCNREEESEKEGAPVAEGSLELKILLQVRI